MHSTTTIRTAEGDCPAHVFTPEAGSGPWPGVLFYMDGLGIRDTLLAMGQRLANAGYLVLLPDLYYRAGPYEPLDPMKVFASDSVRDAIWPLYSTTNNTRAASDTAAFLAWFDQCPDWAGGRIGTTGYCMGGGMSLTAAGTYPERIGAAASFHGGSLATDDPASPHLLAPKMKARVLVAGAVEDESYPPEMAERLERALTEAGVEHTCETYPGALHGWTMPDFPVYDEPAAERHWRELIALYRESLP